MLRLCLIVSLAAGLCFFALVPTAAQTLDDPAQHKQMSPEHPDEQNAKPAARDNFGLLPTGTDPENRLFLPFVQHLAEDQKTFWTAPFRLHKQDAKTIVPFLGFTGALMVGDSWISKQLPDSPGAVQRSRSISNYGIYSLVGGTAALYLWGHIRHDDHKSETGLLAAEAAINSTAVTYAFKTFAGRERPLQGNGSGAFFSGGNSFPSEHAAMAWSIASVVAHEYPGWLPKLLAYGAATGISVSRISGKEHFPSDIVIGSALGWYMGRQIYRARHDRTLSGAAWGSTEPAPNDEPRNVRNTGSPSVPLDSWVYPAFDRLIAQGYVQSAMLALRPWTRMECARLLEEARERMPVEGSHPTEAVRVYHALEREFAFEEQREQGSRNLGAQLESVYSRFTAISGPPLTDGYNFGRTLVNDFGRPFEEGVNTISGLSGYGVAGPLAFYVRGEYQHSPSATGQSEAVHNAIGSQLGVPPLPYTPIAEVNRFRLVEGYVSFTIKDLQFSFGKQALWWGATQSGPLMWSTNAEAIPMLRISNTSPITLPTVFRYLGPMRVESFFGQLDGQQFILTSQGIVGPNLKTQPFVYGHKLSFKPTTNLEFGFSRTVVFAGEGHPLTFGSFARSFISVGDSSANVVDTKNDVGDRRSGFNVSYRVPGLRKFLTIYTDSFCDDDVSPLAAPQRCAWNPGIYVSQVPRLPKFDFRAEGVTTDASGFGSSEGINYSNIIYKNGYTNNGNILGNAIGREARGVQFWSTYWLSPQSKIQASYRHQGVNRNFMQGGHLDDVSVSANFRLHSGVEFLARTQFERWNFPLLAPTTKSNVAVSIGITYWPSGKWTPK